MTDVIRVSGKSVVNKLAGAIVKKYEQNPTHDIILQTIGASATNQACKAVATAGSMLGGKGLAISAKLGFTTVYIDEDEKTALIFRIIIE